MEFLKEKWSSWFATLDVNHDGVLTQADVADTVTNFPKVEGLTGKEGDLASQRIKKWWNTYILRGKETISQEEFLSDLEKEYMENKEAFINRIKDIEYEIISILDTDHTNSISLDNYIKAYKVFGHEDASLVRKAFALYKGDSGAVPIEKLIADWIAFLTNDDPSTVDHVYNTYKAGFV